MNLLDRLERYRVTSYIMEKENCVSMSISKSFLDVEFVNVNVMFSAITDKENLDPMLVHK